MDNNVRPIDMRPYLTGVWGGYDGGCDGCWYLWFDTDMGKSIPHCMMAGPLMRCGRFAPNALYRMYEALND
jgi:hypothetical protein